MNKKIVWFSILVASLIIGLYTFKPMRPTNQLSLKAAPAPAPLVTPEAAPLAAALTAITTRESKSPPILLDPFALRVNVKAKSFVPPTRPAPESEKTLVNEPALEGIWIDAGTKIAFISGQALTVGESIFGWQLVSIARNSVTLAKGAATKKLRLEEK